MTNSASRSPGVPGAVLAQQRPSSRRVVPATCTTHGGSKGFTNLVMCKRECQVELDAHATGACVLRLDEDAAAVVRDQLREWLG